MNPLGGIRRKSYINKNCVKKNGIIGLFNAVGFLCFFFCFFFWGGDEVGVFEIPLI